jgi:hypothetical protein
MEDIVDYIAIVVSLSAVGVSFYTFNKTSGFNKYQEVDEMYMSILKIGIEYPSFRDISKTKNYDKNFHGDEKLKYENYAFIVWNFCETLYDRKFIQDKTWEGVLRYENDLHFDWFKRKSENLFKESFRKYIYEKFD